MNPDPAPSVAEHPAFTAVFDKLMAGAVTEPPPLELARRELERFEAAAALSRDEGTETQHLNAMHYVAIARAEVVRLEKEAIQ